LWAITVGRSAFVLGTQGPPTATGEMTTWREARYGVCNVAAYTLSPVFWRRIISGTRQSPTVLSA